MEMRMALYAQALPRNYKEDNWGNQVSSVWEAVKRELEHRS
jgi:hypothetical protein